MSRGINKPHLHLSILQAVNTPVVALKPPRRRRTSNIRFLSCSDRIEALSGSDKATSHTGESGEVIHNEDIAASVHLPEPNIVDVADIDLVMDTLGGSDRLNTLDSPDTSRADPNSHWSSPCSPGPTNTEIIRSSRLTDAERDSRRSNREAQSNVCYSMMVRNNANSR